MFVLIFLISFKKYTPQETYNNPREEFKKREEEMKIRRKQMDEQISKLIIEQELEDLGPDSGAGIQYNEYSITKVNPIKIPANEHIKFIITTEPQMTGNLYCKFGSIVKNAAQGENNTISCQTPDLSVGEIYVQVSTDRKKWSLPMLVQVFDPNAPSYNTPTALIFMAIAVIGYVSVKIYLRQVKSKRGHKHKFEDPLDQFDQNAPKQLYKETKLRDHL